ncbi:MAG TPA: ribonuclease HI [Candidatus Sulfomarinibacteraceae bacterium]|nr:ribonuclease HI [Candidatus Sulfomarinibacteraceae bacterium]
MKVTIYTDGGSDPNPGIGGWAAILRYSQREKVLTGNHPNTTNNRMELTAAISALKALNRPCEIDFYTDSEYLRRGITEWIDKWAEKGWKTENGKPVSNEDLWRELWPLTRQHEIEWHWVRGHSGDPLNERVDDLAREARLAITPRAQLAPGAPRLYLRASCKGNPGPGGWGVVLEEGADTTQLSGSEPQTTNNRMEVRAAIEGLSLLEPGEEIQVYTTSDYLYQGATNWIHGWRRRDWKKRNGKAIANADLWQELDRLMKEHDVVWVNAKGKQGDDVRGLQEAARLASEAVEIV